MENLISKLKKNIHLLLNIGENLDNRLKLLKLLSVYLNKSKTCLSQHIIDNKKHLTLSDKDDNPIVIFKKKLGNGEGGVAYIVSGTGLNRLFKFSIKLIDSNYIESILEIQILLELTKEVERNYFPNFPITYKVLTCDQHCLLPKCPSIIRETNYFIIINELAKMDLEKWLTKNHSQIEYESIILQIILAIYYLHNIGYIHKDLHEGNILLHKTIPGGFWHYKINDQSIFIPNAGYLIVLWDFGEAESISSKSEYQKDKTFNILNEYKIIYELFENINKKYSNDIRTKIKEKLPENVFIDYILNLSYNFIKKSISEIPCNKKPYIIHI